jgi:hypothetical protein
LVCRKNISGDSFARRDELFLNIHGTGNGFDSRTPAHETTHAVVARIFGKNGVSTPVALAEVYGDEFPDMCAFEKRFQTLIH